MIDHAIFPVPRHVDLEPSTGPPAATPAVEIVEPSIPAQGYELELLPERITLRHADPAGLRYGRQALDSLQEPSDQQLPRGTVRDHPDFAVRGYMLDISRDRVPARETLAVLVERLSALRYNHLQLYTEHTFAYRDHTTVWCDASPMTPADMTWLDETCAAHGIELAANQNTFGHMERWLRHDAYRDRAECPDGWEANGRLRAPTALAPTPDNAAFAVALVRELAATVRSSRVNIGCDEVWELGLGVSRVEVERRGRSAVFVEHLRRIAEPLLSDGFDVQFWADMVQRSPADAAPLAAAGAVACLWGYEAPLDIDPAQIDIDALPEEYRAVARDYFASGAHRGFAPRLDQFADSGFRTWVVPGTSGWNSFVGRHRNAIGNLADAAGSGIAHDVEGMLVTEWGDNGHLQPPFATLPALVYGAGVAWCDETNREMDPALTASRLVDDRTGTFGEALVRLGGVADELGVITPNGTAPFHALTGTSDVMASARAPRADAVAAATVELEAAVSLLHRADLHATDAALLVRETEQAARLVRHGIATLAAGQERVSTEVAPDRRELVAEQRACWLARSRPGGLEDSIVRLQSAPT